MDRDKENNNSDHGSDESFDEIGGPNFADFAKQLQYENENGGYHHPYNTINTDLNSGTYSFPSTITQTETLPKTTEVTTLFLIDSSNRDKNAFPQPTSFTLRLPRLYKSVKSIQLTEVKLLCSFYYFSKVKSNIYLPIIEKGRESIASFNDHRLTKAVKIREGTYGINDLLSEIQTELNYTPLFYDFPNGFSDFINVFSLNGDYSVNFNQPGDTYYDSLNSKFIQNPTIALITSYYWGTRYASIQIFTVDQLKLAYYYPVLYEVLLDTNDLTARPNLNLTIPANLLGTNETAYSHIIFNMSGIDDKAALYLINQNISQLDTYRVNHTFRYSLVNRYQLSYDTNSLQVNITTITLNTSLVNLINNTGSTALTTALSKNSLTLQTYASKQATINQENVVYTEMFTYLQNQFITYLGIPFAKYSPSFFNNPSNIIYFQDGRIATGIRSGYTTDYLTSSNTSITSTSITYSNSPGYWPNINSSNGYIGIQNINKYNIPYNYASKNFLFDNTAIDTTSYYFNTSENSKSVDILIDVLPAQYSIIKFRSPVRQTLQVETLPLPYYYRYSDYNSQGYFKGVVDLNKANVPKKYFDISYAFVYTSTNAYMDSSKYSTNLINTTFGQTFNTSLLSTPSFKLNTLQNYSQFEFIAPYPSSISTGTYVNNTSLSVVSMLTGNISTLFPDNFSMFLYHDRAAFMADLQIPRSEDPIRYIQTAQVNTSNSQVSINFSTFSGHRYYTIFRSNNISCSNTLIKPVIYYNDSNYTEITTDYVNFDPNAAPTDFTNYPVLTNYDTDFLRLPSKPSGLDPASSTFSIALSLKGPNIGYDISGVSNDLTDYIGYQENRSGFYPNTTLNIDPLTYYSFRYITLFDTVNNTYFGSNSSNLLLTPISNNPYIFKGTSNSQVKIVHWYDGFSIPRQLDDRFTTFNTISTSQTSLISDKFNSFPLNINGSIEFGRGIHAIGFLPTDGVYDIESFAFKSYIYPLKNVLSTEDPNLQISHIGVFTGLSLLNNTTTLSTALTVLKYNNSFPYGPNINNTPGFGVGYGTWYNFIYDSSFVSSSNVNISGYTPNSNDLLSYNSMYYMVPFNTAGEVVTYSLLSGSLLPYPLTQSILVSPTFNGNTAASPPGVSTQTEYIIPNILIEGSALGPQGPYSQTQSQYQNSIPITTPSIGYKNHKRIVNDENALYTFSTIFPTSNISLTTYVSEYSNRLFTVNSLSSVISNTHISFPSRNYLSSISSFINGQNSSNFDCINYLVNQRQPLQNYSSVANILVNSAFYFQTINGNNPNYTTRSIELNSSMENITVLMWGGGGGTWLNSSNITGGAGAYAKVSINIQNLLNTSTPDSPGGLSTLYLVVGKGGNRDNFSFTETIGSLQGYEELRYGGGGTSVLGNYVDNNSIFLQGGGFSGLFSGSNLLTATPLLIVGGGGAGGAYTIGGPGGFGIDSSTPPSMYYNFTNSICNTIQYTNFNITSIYYNGSDIPSLYDNNIENSWRPFNIINYYQMSPTASILINTSDTIVNLTKLRYYGPPIGSENIPSGFIIYTNRDKSHILYSNIDVNPEDYLNINDGTNMYNVYDMIIPAFTLTNYSGNALIAGGNGIQYSINGINWAPVNSGFSNITSIQYVNRLNTWYATSSSSIISSSDGINWQICFSSGSTFTSLVSGTILIAGTNTGDIYTSQDGISWISQSLFTDPIKKIRLVNNIFWAIGTTVKVSQDGITWEDISDLSNVNDITIGFRRYVIAETNKMLFSQDGMAWVEAAFLNIQEFNPRSVAFGNNIFVAAGSTTDSTSPIKYSIDGINWNHSLLLENISIRNLEYIGNRFICVSEVIDNPGYAVNQLSILTSIDGINWSYIESGGFNYGEFGSCVSYGPVTIVPDSHSIYLEIKYTTDLMINDIRLYSGNLPLQTDTSYMIDRDITTTYYPSELITLDILDYTYNLSFGHVVPQINTLTIFAPNIQAAHFTGISIYLSHDPNSIVYNNTNILFTNTSYSINFTQPLHNILSLNIKFIKNTVGSIQISDINASYDESLISTQYIPYQITDIDTRSSRINLTTIIDNSLSTSWSPSSFLTMDALRFLFTFNLPVNRIDRIQIYNGLFRSRDTHISGIFIYSDITKTNLIYSNTLVNITNYLSYGLIEITITPIHNISELYVELVKNTPGIPVINEIRFFTIGQILQTVNGYAGGLSISMSETTSAVSYYDGGGGSTSKGGYAGVNAYTGTYLKGGSPAILPPQVYYTNTSNITNGAGGGGGGYYGGGGGGSGLNDTGYFGGAGGGGSGYITSSGIFNILDYGTASPQYNYVNMGINEQIILNQGDVIDLSSGSYYGQGATTDTGMGDHGLIVFNYNIISTIRVSNTDIIDPVYIDGSKLTVFQAPIDNTTSNRTLTFTKYQDSIESSQYAGKNWVWYNSYLSLIGCYLTTTMIPNTSVPSMPLSFPNMPNTIYSLLIQQFSNIVDLYTNGITSGKVDIITSAIQVIFIAFQNIFITVSYNDTSYIEMTELYCILDYLRLPDNLSNPHINPNNPTLDRILGGIPRFGYWANPFLICASYVGFDVSQSQIVPSSLSTIVKSSEQVQAMYGLILEQDLITGVYGFKDIMAYKPTINESMNTPGWQIATQFNNSYYVRTLTNNLIFNKNIPVQPYSFKNAITARLPLFKYSVYTAPLNNYNAPVQILNDFEGPNIYMYSFNNLVVDNVSSIYISNIPITSTIIQMNQVNITEQTKVTKSIIGTLVTEDDTTSVKPVTFFGFNKNNYTPSITFTSTNFYTEFIIDSTSFPGKRLTQVGKAINDMYGNYYFSGNAGESDLYENVSDIAVNPLPFIKNNVNYASPRYILSQYNSNVANPYSDFFMSKYTNIWHLQATSNISAIYGARLNSIYDYTINTEFANQVFYPTHKIVLNKKGSVLNTITETGDLELYPSQQHTQMFFYRNYTSMSNDIYNNYAMEKSSNFSYSDTNFSGYQFNSYINNINLYKSTDFNNDNADSFNYIAIRGYSPSERFKALVRVYLPQRYDFGYISLKDLSNEQLLISTNTLVNSEYVNFLSTFNSAFTINKTFGGTRIAGFTGSNISTSGFGDFLTKFNTINTNNTENKLMLSSITGYSNAAISNLINGDLQYILPSYLATRNRITDPLEFSIPFSSCVTSSNANNPQYGMGYNLGFALQDTSFNTVQRATSFFKILDDYIYLQLNEEYNMNRMDISQPENFSQTLDTTAQSGLYNSKLMLNNFGSFATTFVHSPVLFNPVIGKIDKLSFNWYDSKGVLLNNNDCEWSGTVQIVEAVNTV